MINISKFIQGIAISTIILTALPYKNSQGTETKSKHQKIFKKAKRINEILRNIFPPGVSPARKNSYIRDHEAEINAYAVHNDKVIGNFYKFITDLQTKTETLEKRFSSEKARIDKKLETELSSILKALRKSKSDVLKKEVLEELRTSLMTNFEKKLNSKLGAIVFQMSELERSIQTINQRLKRLENQ